MKKLLNIFRYVFLAICAAIFIYSGYRLYLNQAIHNKGNGVYDDIKGQSSIKKTALYGKLNELEIFMNSLKMKDAGDDSDIPQAVPAKQVSFDELKKINDDIVGWIYSENGIIDYPIVQGDDNIYYLDHLITGEQNIVGSIFMDYRSDGNLKDKNTVVYGHNMKNGSMFMSLNNYKNQDYYDQFPTMELYTPDENYTLEVFAGIVIPGDESYIKFYFENDEDFEDYIKSLKEKSNFKSDVELTKEDKIITLCTCTYEFDNARYTLYAKISPLQNKSPAK